MLEELFNNFIHNLFQPLLLFFYLGFLIPIFRVPFEFPKVLYQSITIYLLVAIGWHGGEKLAELSGSDFLQALGFMVIGFITNFMIGIVAYQFLRMATKMRKVDAATVAGFYGSDSAGTFATCQGILVAGSIASAAYMPVMLAIMEIPGCLVALFLVSRLRRQGMDAHGNMPWEEGYQEVHVTHSEVEEEVQLAGHSSSTAFKAAGADGHNGTAVASRATPHSSGAAASPEHSHHDHHSGESHSIFSGKVLHEVFLNPGLYLLFGGIVVGFVGQLQGHETVAKDNPVFINLFHGVLCLFLLEMGMMACKRLMDLRTAGLPFILFGILAPNVFATFGMLVVHAYSMALGTPFDLGTYPLFAVLCAAASYIAVPAIQRIAIPEASPTLPLAASLGLTFSYNVTIGIPVYLEIAKAITRVMPVGA